MAIVYGVAYSRYYLCYYYPCMPSIRSSASVGSFSFYSGGRRKKKEKSVCYVRVMGSETDKDRPIVHTHDHNTRARMHQPSITSDRTRNSEIDPAPALL